VRQASLDAKRAGSPCRAMMAPWSEHAVLIRHPRRGGDRAIVIEGTLGAVVDHVLSLPREVRSELSISLPDRAVFPFGYNNDALDELVIARTQPGRT